MQKQQFHPTTDPEGHLQWESCLQCNHQSGTQAPQFTNRALVMMMMPSGKWFQRICQAQSIPQFVMMTTFLQPSH
jgi:hypothetical protein